MFACSSFLAQLLGSGLTSSEKDSHSSFVTRVEETIRIRVGIIRADLGDEVAKSGEEAFELATDMKALCAIEHHDEETHAVPRQKQGGRAKPKMLEDQQP